MRALKKIMAALALTAVLAGCSAHNILSSIQGGKADMAQLFVRSPEFVFPTESK